MNPNASYMRFVRILLISISCFSLDAKKAPLQFSSGDTQFGVTAKYRPDLFIGKNINLANSNNNEDRTFYARHSFDIVFDYIYGKETYTYDVVKFRWDLRNKAIWGVAANVPTTNVGIKDEAGVVFGNHSHFIARHLFWMRQLWLEASLPDVLGVKTKYKHTVTLGAFPFVLGRGIALGDAYAVDTKLLGFDPETAVDQYAYGIKFSGELVKSHLTYDLYASIQDSKQTSLSETNAPIYNQRYDYRTTPARGPGHIRYIAAARLMWSPVKNETQIVTLQPYGLFSNIPEQKIEFAADAESKLGTLGLAGDFALGNLEFGFDAAFNLGRQKVFGWDRNAPKRELRDGQVYLVNSAVNNADNGKSAIINKNNSFIIGTSPESERFNGQEIDNSSLKNSSTRFSDPYENSFNGSMAVFDATYWILPKELGVSAAIGYASGDESPHFDIRKGEVFSAQKNYEGFISLQEVYNGSRVESSFFMAGSGKLPRIVSQPDSGLLFTEIDQVSSFTNLRHVGIGLEYSPKNSPSKLNLQPNMLGFWSDIVVRKPLLNNETEKCERFASMYYGLEVNTLADALLLPDLKIFGKIALFFPGAFYKDYKNSPINNAQRKYLENKAVLEKYQKDGGIDPQIILIKEPLLGSDTCLAINVGLEYRF